MSFDLKVDTTEEFAGERSHRSSQISNEHSRATAQAVILINGGAATALLAFLAKDKIDPLILHNVPYCLGLYALGVLFGALMMWTLTIATGEWSLYWMYVSRKDEPKSIEAQQRAERAWFWVKFSFAANILCFAMASAILAALFVNSKPPQTIPNAPASLSATPKASLVLSRARLPQDHPSL